MCKWIKVGSIGEDAGKWTLNISSKTIDATAFLEGKLALTLKLTGVSQVYCQKLSKTRIFQMYIALVPE